MACNTFFLKKSYSSYRQCIHGCYGVVTSTEDEPLPLVKKPTPRRLACESRTTQRSSLHGGRCFALLAPRSLRPSGHLRCASSPPPGGLVVSAVIFRAKARPCRMDRCRRDLPKDRRVCRSRSSKFPNKPSSRVPASLGSISARMESTCRIFSKAK